jgi:hypothetical protein
MLYLPWSAMVCHEWLETAHAKEEFIQHCLFEGQIRAKSDTTICHGNCRLGKINWQNGTLLPTTLDEGSADLPSAETLLAQKEDSVDQ